MCEAGITCPTKIYDVFLFGAFIVSDLSFGILSPYFSIISARKSIIWSKAIFCSLVKVETSGMLKAHSPLMLLIVFTNLPFIPLYKSIILLINTHHLASLFRCR